MSGNIKTRIHAYSFNTSDADQSAEYRKLCERLKKEGLRKFHSHGGARHVDTARPIDGRTIELETEHLFDNQWNTAPIVGVTDKGLRVFDWAEDYRPAALGEASRKDAHSVIRTGHYLEQTEEMRAARAGRVACGYCGKQYPAAHVHDVPGFCGACCDSAYLTEKDLFLTRVHPVTDGMRRTLEPLTDKERAALLPRFTDAQLRGRRARDADAEAKQRARVAKIVTEAKQKAARKVVAAQREQAGFQWLLDRGFWGLLDNVIYYDHTDSFHFGWRSKDGLPDSVVGQLLDVISEFPAAYEISTATRGKLSGGQG